MPVEPPFFARFSSVLFFGLRLNEALLFLARHFLKQHEMTIQHILFIAGLLCLIPLAIGFYKSLGKFITGRS